MRNSPGWRTARRTDLSRRRRGLQEFKLRRTQRPDRTPKPRGDRRPRRFVAGYISALIIISMSESNATFVTRERPRTERNPSHAAGGGVARAAAPGAGRSGSLSRPLGPSHYTTLYLLPNLATANYTVAALRGSYYSITSMHPTLAEGQLASPAAQPPSARPAAAAERAQQRSDSPNRPGSSTRRQALFAWRHPRHGCQGPTASRGPLRAASPH